MASPDKVALLGRWKRLPPPVQLFCILLTMQFLWFGVLGTIRAGVSPDFSVRPADADVPIGGSRAIGMAVAILNHEVNGRSFTPNDPSFYPTGFARRTRAFQTRAVQTVSLFLTSISDVDAGSSLAEAVERVSIPPAQWWLKGGWPFVVAPAESHYRRAIEALRTYNQQLAETTQPGEMAEGLSRHAHVQLAALLQAIEAEAGRGERVIRGNADVSGAVQLAGARGTAWAAALLLRGVRDDNASSIRLSGQAARWNEAIDALERAALSNPALVRSDDLMQVGYSLLVAGNAIRAILKGQGTDNG